MAANRFDLEADALASQYRTPPDLGDDLLRQEPIGLQFGKSTSDEPDETSVTALSKQHLQTKSAQAKQDKIVRRAVLAGYTIDQVVQVFNLDRRTACNIYYHTHASATIEDFQWDPADIAAFKRAATLKLALEGTFSDDPKMKRLALTALAALGDEKPDPTVEPSPQSAHWEAVRRVGGHIDYDEVLDKKPEPE